MKTRTVVVIVAVTVALSACAVVAVVAALGRRPDVEREFSVYVERIVPAKKLVLVEAGKRLAFSERTAGYLFGNTDLGRTLNIRSDATVEVSAWASLSFAVDFSKPSSISFDASSGTLRAVLPPLELMEPAVDTRTIEVRTTDRSIFLDESRLEAEARAGISRRFRETANALLSDPDIAGTASSTMSGFLKLFAGDAGLRVEAVDLTFGSPGE